MTKEEYEQVIQTIKKYMHTDYLGIGYCKTILDSNSLVYVCKELKEMITNEK